MNQSSISPVGELSSLLYNREAYPDSTPRFTNQITSPSASDAKVEKTPMTVQQFTRKREDNGDTDIICPTPKRKLASTDGESEHSAQRSVRQKVAAVAQPLDPGLELFDGQVNSKEVSEVADLMSKAEMKCTSGQDRA
jgi:hypothetical protein